MDVISELENEFSALENRGLVTQITVQVGDEALVLKLPELGFDYLCGLHRERLVVIPKGSISEVRGSALPDEQPSSLVDFLTRQRSPIRVNYRIRSEIGSCWLLNVRGSWVRVSLSRGIVWLPLEAISFLEVMAVDN